MRFTPISQTILINPRAPKIIDKRSQCSSAMNVCTMVVSNVEKDSQPKERLPQTAPKARAWPQLDRNKASNEEVKGFENTRAHS
jgi:hypothetical protein